MGDDFDRGAWLADQALLVERLAGQVVCDWCGVEIALRETGPQFGDHEVGCVQLVHLVASLKTDAVASFTTYQDDGFGLHVGDPDPVSRHHWAGIYENNDSSLDWHRFDESVLAFSNITAADRVA